MAEQLYAVFSRLRNDYPNKYTVSEIFSLNDSSPYCYTVSVKQPHPHPDNINTRIGMYICNKSINIITTQQQTRRGAWSVNRPLNRRIDSFVALQAYINNNINDPTMTDPNDINHNTITEVNTSIDNMINAYLPPGVIPQGGGKYRKRKTRKSKKRKHRKSRKWR